MNLDFSWDELSKNLQANAQAPAFKKFEADKRFWKLAKNEDGSGAAVIRLMYDRVGKPVPFVKIFHYGMKKFIPGSPKPIWFIANSPESIGAPCPVQEHYMALKAEGTDEALKESENFKRQTKFYANIMVVKDPSNPENEGKMFLWEFGTKMKDRIVSWLKPTQEELDMGEEAKDLYNPMNGYSIKLKIKKQGDFFSYDETSLMPSPTAVFESKEDAVDFIGKNAYKLDEFLQPEAYDSYETLKGRLNKFLNNGKSDEAISETRATAKAKPAVIDDMDFDEPAVKAKPTAVEVEDDEAWLDNL